MSEPVQPFQAQEVNLSGWNGGAFSSYVQGKNGFAVKGLVNGLSMGYDWPQNGYTLGVEATGETGNVYNLVLVNATSTASSSVRNLVSLTANAKMNPIESSSMTFSPFIKGGLSLTDSYYGNVTASSSQQTGLGYKSFKAGWTAGVGADVNIGKDTDMRFGYNYWKSGKFNHGITTAGTASFNQTLNQIQVGLRHKF